MSRHPVLLALAAMLAFAASDALAKSLGGAVPALQIAWTRFAVAAAGLGVLALILPGASLRTSAPMGQVLRGAGMAASTFFLVMALHRMPMAEATSLAFLSPVIVTLMAGLVLRERIAPLQWAGVLGGLAGVVIVVGPGQGRPDPVWLLPVLSAKFWALGIICSRRVLASEPVRVTLTWSALIGLALFSAPLHFVWQAPDASSLMRLLAMSILWCLAHFCIVLAYAGPQTPVSRLAPLSYSHMLWAVCLGALVFGEIPGIPVLLGCGLIVLSGCMARFLGGSGDVKG